MTDIKLALRGKKHVIWDWNGTLLDDVDHAIATVNSLLTDHGLPILDRTRYREVFDFPILKYYQALGFDFKKESFENLCHRFVEKFMSGLSNLSVIPEMKDLLEELHRDQMTQSILSASDQSSLDQMILHYDLGDYFRFVFGIENKFAGSKIDRGHELIRNSGISREKTIIIGDTLHDLDVAEALGIDAILVAHGHQNAERLRVRHKHVFELEEDGDWESVF